MADQAARVAGVDAWASLPSPYQDVNFLVGTRRDDICEFEIWYHGEPKALIASGAATISMLRRGKAGKRRFDDEGDQYRRFPSTVTAKVVRYKNDTAALKLPGITAEILTHVATAARAKAESATKRPSVEETLRGMAHHKARERVADYVEVEAGDPAVTIANLRELLALDEKPGAFEILRVDRSEPLSDLLEQLRNLPSSQKSRPGARQSHLRLVVDNTREVPNG